MKTYSISEAADLLDIPASTLRYYDSYGFIPSIHRDAGGRRVFTENDILLLGALRRAANSDLTLPQFRKLYEAVMLHGDHREGRQLLEEKCTEIEEKIHHLQESLLFIRKTIAVYDAFIAETSEPIHHNEH